MDFYASPEPQCHSDTAMDMDSPASANFYDIDVGVDKQFVVKQEPFDKFEESDTGLGHFLQREESVDLGAYLERFDQVNNTTASTGDELVRQLAEDIAAATRTRQQLDEIPARTPGARPTQHSERNSLRSVGPMQFESIPHSQVQGQTIMPLSSPQNHVVGDQADSLVPEIFAYDVVHQLDNHNGQIELEVEVNSTTSSAASSPARPTSSDAQAQGSGAAKRKRAVPPPGTVEYQQKRERNNIAVRKSREKTKVRNKELQDKVGELQGENSSLKKRVEMLTKELTVLKSLFTGVNRTVPERLNNAPMDHM